MSSATCPTIIDHSTARTGQSRSLPSHYRVQKGNSFSFHPPPNTVLTMLMNSDMTVLAITPSLTNSTVAGSQLRSVREHMGLSRRHVAEQLGVTIAAVQDYERSEAAGRITLTTLRKYAAVLECDVTVTVRPRDSAAFTTAGQSKAKESRAPRSSRAPAAPVDTPTPTEVPPPLNERMGLWCAE